MINLDSDELYKEYLWVVRNLSKVGLAGYIQWLFLSEDELKETNLNNLTTKFLTQIFLI